MPGARTPKSDQDWRRFDPFASPSWRWQRAHQIARGEVRRRDRPAGVDLGRGRSEDVVGQPPGPVEQERHPTTIARAYGGGGSASG